MSKRLGAYRRGARWWGGRVALVLSAGVVLNCGASGEDGALFDPMDPVTGGATLGIPGVTSSEAAATTSSSDGTSGDASSNGTPATAGSTTSGGSGGGAGQGGVGSGGSAAGGTSGGDGGTSATGGNGGSGGVTGTGGLGGTGGGSGGVGDAGGTAGSGGNGGDGGAGSASTSSTGGIGGDTAGTGGNYAFGGAAGAPGGAGGESGCGLRFQHRPNTVYFALDRSSSMIDDDFWDPVKEGVLDTVAAMQGRMRFGFAAFTGQSDLTCPLDLTAAETIGLRNFVGISAVLDPLEPPDPEGVKGETPTAAAIAAVRAKLAADPSPGKIYVLLITDGDPDFCNDAEAACPSDALVYELQTAYLEGVETRLFNIAGGAATASRLEAFARAGRGLSVRGNSQNIHNACQADPTWAARLSALGGGVGDSLGSYVGMAPAGSYVTLDPSDAPALSSTLSNETAELMSCFFDLAGGTLAEGQESAVSIELAGKPLVYGDADGWTLHSGSLLELTGEACATLRATSAPAFRIDIDCDVLE